MLVLRLEYRMWHYGRFGFLSTCNGEEVCIYVQLNIPRCSKGKRMFNLDLL